MKGNPKTRKPKPLVKVPRGTMLELAPDEHRLSARVGRAGQIWDLEARAKLADLALLPYSMHIIFAPAGPLVASVNTKGVIGIYDGEQGGPPLRKMKMAAETHAPVFIDDDLLLVADWAGNLVVWDVHNGAEVSRLCFPGCKVKPFGVLGDGRGHAQIRQLGDHTPYEWASFDPRFTEEIDARITFVDTPDLCLRDLVPHPSGSPLSVRAHGFVELVEIPSRKVIAHHDLDRMYLANVRYSPDGKYAMFSNWERCWILDGSSFEPRWTYPGDSEMVPTLSPGGRWFSMKNQVWSADDLVPLMDALSTSTQ